jgi:putative hemolysin
MLGNLYFQGIMENTGHGAHAAGMPQGRLLSYVSADDGLLRRWLIGGLEVLTGRRRLERLYRQIQAMDIAPTQIWGEALRLLHIDFALEAAALAAVPREGPLVIIANHPFGVVDGLVLGHLASLLRPRFHFLVNSLLVRQDPRLAHFLLPIDFADTKDALATNLASRQASIARMQQGEALVIFPAGGVATAPRGFGVAEELEWKRFVAKMVQQAQATVLPVHFHGQNSRLFHLASRVSMQLRLGLLLHEINNKRGHTLQVDVRAAIPWETMRSLRDRQALLTYLQDAVFDRLVS